MYTMYYNNAQGEAKRLGSYSESWLSKRMAGLMLKGCTNLRIIYLYTGRVVASHD